MDEDYCMTLLKLAQLINMSEKSKEHYRTLMDFDYEGKCSFECSEIKKLISNAFIIGYNCGMDKQSDKELENDG